MINQAGVSCIASDSARSVIRHYLGDTVMVIFPEYWYQSNRTANQLAPHNGGCADNSHYDYDAHRTAVDAIITASVRSTVDLLPNNDGKIVEQQFWQEFNQRNSTRTGQIWNITLLGVNK